MKGQRKSVPAVLWKNSARGKLPACVASGRASVAEQCLSARGQGGGGLAEGNQVPESLLLCNKDVYDFI